MPCEYRNGMIVCIRRKSDYKPAEWVRAFNMTIIRQTEKAILFEQGLKEFWLPKGVVKDVDYNGTYMVHSKWAIDKEIDFEIEGDKNGL